MAKPKKGKEGEVHVIDPRHIVKPKNRPAYYKSHTSKSKKHVVIVEDNTQNKKVKVSPLDTVKGKTKKGYVELKDYKRKDGAKTQVSKRKYGFSHLFNRPFYSNKDPFNKRPRKKLSNDDWNRIKK